jgi:hypothetical protein
MKNDLIKKATELIQNSSIINKDDLIKLVAIIMNEEDLKDFISLVSDDTSILDLLSKNFEKKKTLSLSDINGWNKLIDGEEKTLSSIN